MSDNKIPEDAKEATLTGMNPQSCLVQLTHPDRPALRHLQLLRRDVFTEEDTPELPLKGYIVYSSTDQRGWYSFFEEGWEHGELT